MQRASYKQRFVVALSLAIVLVALFSTSVFAVEPVHAPIQSSSTTANDPSKGALATVTTTDASCSPKSAAVTISPKLQPGDLVHISATLIATDGETVQEEQSEGEFLQIFDTAHTVTRQGNYLSNLDLYGMDGKKGNVLKACIINADGDEKATIIVTVTRVSTLKEILLHLGTLPADVAEILLGHIPIIVFPGTLRALLLQECASGHTEACNALQTTPITV